MPGVFMALPIAWYYTTKNESGDVVNHVSLNWPTDGDYLSAVPVYAKQEPFSYEVADDIYDDWYSQDLSGVDLVRRVEAAHGITRV